jgi:hypothetical protein
MEKKPGVIEPLNRPRGKSDRKRGRKNEERNRKLEE